ncbi:L,D-transpeptidase [Amycolatopsis dongchuanensis]|uniref:L,D-TPase catalytic domain-containing protein n=1 Tax=Amycolatopsis dongchuanensis TaxID=1070866 RepID=A0ABP9PYP5_9PSEU
MKGRTLWVSTALLAFAAGCAPAAGSAPVLTSTTAAPVSTTPPPPVTSTPEVPPPCGPAVAACVSLSRKKAWLLRDGVVVLGPVQAEPGGPESPTPVGSFRVEWKDREHYSSEYNHEPMPNSVFFAAGGIAFHAGSLERSSHGCVHLSDADSAAFFDALGVHARVQVVD